MSGSLAELTRTAVLRASSVRLRGRALPPLTVLDHLVDAGGAPLLIVREPAATIAGLGIDTDARPATAVAVDVSPVPLRDRIRATVAIGGSLGRVDAERAGPVLESFAVASPWPESTAETAGDDFALLRLAPAAVRATTGCGCYGTAERGERVDLDAYCAAPADPLAGVEGQWLSHLAAVHPEELQLLAQHAAPAAVAAGARVRACGLDRHGISFRVEHPHRLPAGSCAEVQIGFAQQVSCLCSATSAFNVLVRDVLGIEVDC